MTSWRLVALGPDRPRWKLQPAGRRRSELRILRSNGEDGWRRRRLCRCLCVASCESLCAGRCQSGFQRQKKRCRRRPRSRWSGWLVMARSSFDILEKKLSWGGGDDQWRSKRLVRGEESDGKLDGWQRTRTGQSTCRSGDDGWTGAAKPRGSRLREESESEAGAKILIMVLAARIAGLLDQERSGQVERGEGGGDGGGMRWNAAG